MIRVVLDASPRFRSHQPAWAQFRPRPPSVGCPVPRSDTHSLDSRPVQHGCRATLSGMEKTRHNVTLVVDEDLLLAARKVALDRRTSVNQLVREFLAALVDEPNRRRLARARLRQSFEAGLVNVGDRAWNRDDLYDL